MQPNAGSRSDEIGELLIAALPRLHAFARWLCGNRTLADDLVQEAAIRALANPDSFKRGTNFNAWVNTILRNHFYSERRKRKREVEDVDDRLAGNLSELPEQEGHLAIAEFLRALHTISDEQRDALILVGAAGFSCYEAADICDVRVGTIKSRVSRARARLKIRLFASAEC